MIDEEEAKMNQIFNIEKEKKDKEYSEPIDEDQERKKEKFKSYLFSEAQNITTPELLAQIVNIIQGSYIDEIKIRNEIANREENEENSELQKENKNVLNYEMNNNNSTINSNPKEPEFIIDEKGVKKYR